MQTLCNVTNPVHPCSYSRLRSCAVLTSSPRCSCSLKSLLVVKFEEDSTDTAPVGQRACICGVCRRSFSNNVKAFVLKPCGDVIWSVSLRFAPTSAHNFDQYNVRRDAVSTGESVRSLRDESVVKGRIHRVETRRYRIRSGRTSRGEEIRSRFSGLIRCCIIITLYCYCQSITRSTSDPSSHRHFSHLQPRHCLRWILRNECRTRERRHWRDDNVEKNESLSEVDQHICLRCRRED